MSLEKVCFRVLGISVLLLCLSSHCEGFIPSRFLQQGHSSSQKMIESSETTIAQEDVVVDRSTLTLLEHVNINVPTQEYILPFYFQLLGCGMDPRKATNLLPDSPKQTLWANCGASQFHLPYGETAQRIPGHIGLRYHSLDALKERLKDPKYSGCFQSYEIVEGDRECVQIVDTYGNEFRCRAGAENPRDSMRQPLISDNDHSKQPWWDLAAPYQREESECLGIDYVEFQCPPDSAERIALFYDSVLDATTTVLEDRGTKVAIVAFGNIYETGKSDQSLIFRETSTPLANYDGHHVAMYVGSNKADFEQAFKNAQTAGVVWVNPRFSDKAMNLQGAKKWKQFRFKDIVDMKTGKRIMELEHEMRSVQHEAWPGPKQTEA